jgi:2,4-dienoyl-CoA reductase-like NADH-dependent reductase (Old Yellow Enzyme family)/thioredoxin reductase
MASFPHLFSPIELGGLTLPNRIVHVPTDISSSNADGEVSERDIHHHREIAKGGTGFVIVGATTPDRATGRPTVTCLVADGDEYVPGLARLAEAMHRYGARCAVQLQHPGRQCAIPRYNTLGATDRVLKLPWSAGHEIIYENAEEKGKEIREASIPEILGLVDLFSEAAWRVKQAGFDAVELHAAHGYLLSEFMSPYLNMRTDRFGGSFENRMRFPLAVIDSIQRKCGKAFPVLVRYSFEEWCPGGRGLEEGLETARVLERVGVAALDLSQGMQESPGAGFDPMPYPQGWATYAAEATKAVVRIPVITSHSLRDPEYCEQILAEGKTDLVGLARQLLADPYWPVKAQYDRVKQIRRCISCLGGCWQESLMAKKEIACSINAACGNPAFAEMRRTTTPVRVAVVGGGPAGMEAARVATERGHLVTLFERATELGGALKYVCMVPGKEKMRWYLDWIRDQLLDLHVDIRLGHAPTVNELRGYDLVVNATGATSFVPPVIGDASRVVPFEETMACPKVACECHPGGRRMRKLGARVLIWGDGYAATDTAAWLADIGREVTIVTEQREFAAETEVIHRYVLLKRFAQGDAEVLESRPYKHPVTVLTSTTVAEIRDGEVVLQDKDFGRTTLAVDDIVTCHTRPVTDVLEALRVAGVRVINVGDSVRPRNLFHAVKEGSAVGLEVDEHLLFNPNGAILNDLPLDVLAQLTREEGPAYTAHRMVELAAMLDVERDASDAAAAGEPAGLDAELAGAGHAG